MKTNTYEAIITAYCACSICCGPDARGLTAIGTVPRAAITIAAPTHIPMASTVVVHGRQYRVEDRTAKRFDGRFDIYFKSHAEARRFGIRTNQVTVITK